MADLQRLIEQFGKPDALIDHWDSTSNRYAIWVFSEKFILDGSGKAIINGEPSKEPPLVILQKTLDDWKTNCPELAAVGFISYDLKNFLFPHIPFKEPQLSQPLLWFGKPKRVIPYENIEIQQNSFSPFLQLERDLPSPQKSRSDAGYPFNNQNSNIRIITNIQKHIMSEPLDDSIFFQCSN